jgi:hypothetical protein
VVGIILGVYVGMTMLLSIPYVQRQTAAVVAGELTKLIDAPVSVGRIDMGLLNRIIIDDLHVDDRSGKELLRARRLSAKINILPLLKGKVSISSVQLFGFAAKLRKANPDAEANYRFILDAFASNDDDTKKSDLDLRINSILIRRGHASYDVESEPQTPGVFNASHINLQNIIANISLKALRTDSVNASIKRMSVDEENSGFSLKKLTMKLTANERHTSIDNFSIGLPGSLLSLESISLDYDSLGAFSHFADMVKFRLKSAQSHIAPTDISAFVPALKEFREPLDIDFDIDGTLNRLHLNHLDISRKQDIALTADGELVGIAGSDKPYVYGRLSRLYLSAAGIDEVTRSLTGSTPAPLANLGSVAFSGEVEGNFDNLSANGSLTTDIGDLAADLRLRSDSANGLLAYSGSLQTDGLDLSKLLADDKFGNITFNLNVDGKHRDGQRPEIDLEGVVSDLQYNGYTYDNINIDGEYINGGFSGYLALDDDNGRVTLSGDINPTEKVPTFNFTATVDSLYPNRLRLTDKYKDGMFSVRVSANFIGGSIDDMDGTIDIDSLCFRSPEKNYSLSNLHIDAAHDDEGNRISIDSPFMDADFIGHFRYSTMAATVTNLLSRYIPSFVSPAKSAGKGSNQVDFDINVYNTKLLSDMLDIPIHIYMPSTLKGSINEKASRLNVEGYFPRMRYGDKILESAMVRAYNDRESLTCKLRFTERQKDDDINVSLEAVAANDKLNTTVNWGNSAMTTYSGRLSAATAFFKRQEAGRGVIKTVVDINPTDIILNDTLWQIHKSQVVIEDGNVEVNRFLFNNNDRYLMVNGRASKSPTDTLIVDLKEINLGYVFDIADVTDDVKFAGDATGRVYASNLSGDPQLHTHLDVRGFSLNDALLGDLDIYGSWNNENKGIRLDAVISERTGGKSTVNGFIFPIKPTSGLDLNIHAERLNIRFIHRYMESIVDDLTGDVTGDVHFYGKFKALTLNGSAMANARMRFDILGTNFFVNDSVRLHPEGIDFTDIHITDATRGGKGVVNGELRYNHFKDIRYHLNINMQDMLVMNRRESVDFPIYGKVYATGSADLQGNAADGLTATVAVSTNKNTTFAYNTAAATTATDTQFITFTDKTPATNRDSIHVSTFYDDIAAMRRHEDRDDDSAADIRLNLLIDATPDASMKIVMDPVAGDYISGKGTGSIKAEFYNKGDFKLFGNYNIQQGVYKFSLQEVIRKDFNIKSGTIAFNGDPMEANLDIQASYTVPSASLNDLIPDASAIVQQPNVKVNCLMNISGMLQHPTIDMSIELPNERDEVQALVRNYISTDEQMNMQMLYLLGIGKFYTENNVNGQQSDMMSSVLSSTLSGQLNNILSHMIDNNNWNIGTNLSTGEKGWTDMEIEGILSGQLLNNRLIVNGNFGYRENPMANTNFVGDFDAEWLITRSGDIRLKAYNETNDRYYTRTNLTTQGVGIMFRKDFDRWNDLLFWNKIRRNRIAKRQQQEEEESLKESE